MATKCQTVEVATMVAVKDHGHHHSLQTILESSRSDQDKTRRKREREVVCADLYKHDRMVLI